MQDKYKNAVYMTISEIKADISRAIDIANVKDVIITRFGQPVAVLIPYDDYVLFIGTLEEARGEQDAQGGDL